MADTFVSQTRDALTAFWGERNERERKQIALAGVVALLALVYAVLIDPAYSGRAKLQKNLPTLRQQAADMQAMAGEAGALANNAAPPAPEMTKEGLDASMASKGLKAQNVAVTGNLAKIQLSAVSFAGVVAWLDEVQKSARVTVLDANVTVLPQADSVNVTLSLQQQKSE
ncbi:MAG: type II secretion system protein M [Proteobacteria bacterium]|nr:type II secretion system protein M [Pseudomonadota bacterium]